MFVLWRCRREPKGNNVEGAECTFTAQLDKQLEDFEQAVSEEPKGNNVDGAECIYMYI